MTSNKIYEVVKDTVSIYIEGKFTDTTNLLGITSVRNIIYILTDLELNTGLRINDAFIKEIKDLSVVNLVKLIPKYSEQKASISN